MKAMVSLSREEINLLQYPVVVEMWRRISQPGSKRRLWLVTFNENERALAAEWCKKFYQWHLITGVPESVVMSPNTLLWLRTKLIPFFGQL
jgi:hypothetical protein